MDPETWILQRILRYKDAETWMLRHESDTWILQRILRFEDAETWIRRHGLIYGSGDMDLAEDPEIHMDAETWFRRHGSCRGSWDTYGCLYTDPATWILQRSLRYKDAEIWAQRRGSCRESWDTKMLILRRHGSCRGAWDTKMLRYEPKDVDLVENPEIRRCWYSGHMDLAEDPEIRRCWDMNPKNGSCGGPWDIKILRHESETWILQRILRYIRIRRHGSCRGSWDTKMLRHEC